MSLLATLRTVQARVSERPSRLRESGPATGNDPDAAHTDFQWYRKQGKSPRDIPDATWKTVANRSIWASVTNPLAFRWADLIDDLMIVRDFKIEAKHEKVQELLNAFWRSPHNDWEGRLKPLNRCLRATGMLALPVAVEPGTGSVRVDYMDPGDIGGFIATEGSSWRHDAIRIGTAADGVTIPIVKPIVDAVNFGRLQGHPPATAKPNEPHGVMLFKLRGLLNMSRGVGDFTAAIDPLTLLDDLVATDMERAKILAAYLGHVGIEGGTKGEIDERAAMLAQMPGMGAIFVHDGRTSPDLAAPPSGASDFDIRYRTHRNTALAPSGFQPAVIAGDMGEGNRAVATSATDPANYHIEACIADLCFVIRFACRYAIDCAVMTGNLAGVKPEDETFEVSGPRVVKKDMALGASTLNTASQALALAESQGWIPKSEARRSFVGLLPEIGRDGVDVDAMEDELGATADGLTPEQRKALAAELDATGAMPADGAATGTEQEGDNLQQKRLLGTAIADIVRQVGANEVPPESAKAILVTTYGLTPAEAASIIDPAETLAKARPVEPVATPVVEAEHRRPFGAELAEDEGSRERWQRWEDGNSGEIMPGAGKYEKVRPAHERHASKKAYLDDYQDHTLAAGAYTKARDEGAEWVKGQRKSQALDELHAETQTKLQKMVKDNPDFYDPDGIDLYRGIVVDADHPLAIAARGGRVKAGHEFDADGMTLASYSEDPGVAANFAHPPKGKVGIVLERKTRYEDVVMSNRTQDLKAKGELEWVARNKGKARVRVHAVTIG